MANPLWDDADFTIETGHFPGRTTLSAAEIGPGIIYYSGETNIQHRLAGQFAPFAGPRESTAKLNVLWNPGSATEIINPNMRPSEFVRVALKAPAAVAERLPEQSLGVAYAGLLEADWAQPFKKSVQDDLDIIGSFVDPLRRGQRDAALALVKRAVLAKEDLDLKLAWSAAEFGHRGVLNSASYMSFLAAAAATGVTKVTVNTVDAAKNSVNGCRVNYVTFINVGYPAYYYQFPRLSTPTDESLAIGRYEMWAEKNGLTGPKAQVRVTSTSSSLSVDLIAP